MERRGAGGRRKAGERMLSFAYLESNRSLQSALPQPPWMYFTNGLSPPSSLPVIIPSGVRVIWKPGLYCFLLTPFYSWVCTVWGQHWMCCTKLTKSAWKHLEIFTYIQDKRRFFLAARRGHVLLRSIRKPCKEYLNLLRYWTKLMHLCSSDLIFLEA